jgi:hypothetical protein
VRLDIARRHKNRIGSLHWWCICDVRTARSSGCSFRSCHSLQAHRAETCSGRRPHRIAGQRTDRSLGYSEFRTWSWSVLRTCSRALRTRHKFRRPGSRRPLRMSAAAYSRGRSPQAPNHRRSCTPHSPGSPRCSRSTEAGRSRGSTLGTEAGHQWTKCRRRPPRPRSTYRPPPRRPFPHSSFLRSSFLRSSFLRPSFLRSSFLRSSFLHSSLHRRVPRGSIAHRTRRPPGRRKRGVRALERAGRHLRHR